jgi:hypothetical protein
MAVGDVMSDNGGWNWSWKLDDSILNEGEVNGN